MLQKLIDGIIVATFHMALVFEKFDYAHKKSARKRHSVLSMCSVIENDRFIASAPALY